MPLIEELTASGNWLFRWRSYLPLVLIGFFLVFVGEWRTEEGLFASRWWEAVCSGVSLVGFTIRAYAVGHAPRGTSGRNTGRQYASTLNTTGAYSLVRHPLYVGNFFMGLGVALFTGVWWMALIYVLVFWIYYERIMTAEEAFLAREFGGAFVEWASRTPAFLPRPSGYVAPELSFSLRNVLRREYNGLYAVVAILTVFDLVGRWSSQGTLVTDPVWGWIFGGSTVLWLLALTIKRRTDWLVVEGR